MKRIMSVVLVLIICFCLCACGKSEAAEMVDSLILSIGTVSLNSEAAISAAENAYNQLPDKDREKIDNLAKLIEARTVYNALKEDALKQAIKEAEEAEKVNQMIQLAREKWETFDVGGTLSLLDSIEPITNTQKEEINAFYAEIETSCYTGTHFLKVEHRLNINSDKYLTFADGTKFSVTHDETQMTDKITYHLYAFWGSKVFSKFPGMAYTEWCGESLSVEEKYPELWAEWAIYDKGESLKYPEQARVDDLGNILAWYYRSTNDVAELEFTIYLVNPDTRTHESSFINAGSNTGKTQFSNRYGTATTPCAHNGCNNNIAPSGDTNCCTTHSNKCLNCGCYIDEDAMYCMSCLTNSVTNNSSTGNQFTNKYGSSTTKCAYSGCNNYIAPSGDTNCCTTHSNKCLNCKSYIDSDAMYCMSCLLGNG